MKVIGIDGREEQLKKVVYFRGRPYDVMTDKSVYDFSYCRRDDTVYYTHVGSGGFEEVLLSGHSPEHRDKYGIELWLADDVTPVKLKRKKGPEIDWRSIPIDPEAKGYTVLDKPHGDPFEDAVAAVEVLYCTKCRDRFPDDAFCEHLYYCFTCDTYAGPNPTYQEACTCDDPDKGPWGVPSYAKTLRWNLARKNMEDDLYDTESRMKAYSNQFDSTE